VILPPVRESSRRPSFSLSLHNQAPGAPPRSILHASHHDRFLFVVHSQAHPIPSRPSVRPRTPVPFKTIIVCRFSPSLTLFALGFWSHSYRSVRLFPPPPNLQRGFVFVLFRRGLHVYVRALSHPPGSPLQTPLPVVVFPPFASFFPSPSPLKRQIRVLPVVPHVNFMSDPLPLFPPVPRLQLLLAFAYPLHTNPFFPFGSLPILPSFRDISRWPTKKNPDFSLPGTFPW